MREPVKQNFIKSAAILAAASIIVKIIGAIYKIPLFNILDDAGTGSYQVTYNVYILLLTISTAGIPAALSRLVSTAAASGQGRLAKRYFSVALPAFIVIGVAVTLVMYLFADAFAGWMNDSLAAPGIRVLAPAVLFVCVISVYRGYAQGYENMVPTAISQIAEVVCKAVVGFTAAIMLTRMHYASHLVSAGAIMGVTVGLGLCIPLLVWYKKRIDLKLQPDDDSGGMPGIKSVLGRIMGVSIPITLSSSFMSIMTVIDTSVVLGRLKSSYILAQTLTAEVAEEAARVQFGIYTKGLTIYNLPPAIVVPVSVSIIPAIAAALARKRASEASGIMGSSIKLVNLIAMPAAAGIMALATPILIALYNDSRQITSTILIIQGAASFFVCLQYITTAVLQANGYERVALLTFPIGAAVKIILGYFLVYNPSIGIVGSSIGTLACFMVISALNIAFIQIKIKDKPKLIAAFIKPLLCTAAMACIAYLSYAFVEWLGAGIIGQGRFSVVVFLAISILLSVAAYAALIVVTHAITKDDMALLPKGEKLAKILRIK
ncbi:MAG: polysaccharide biosynthesis protein [Oscillospiraceae bacterium]|nr:polysaccharide biosynthesis protein [Oscillospiraceae bacterium]